MSRPADTTESTLMDALMDLEHAYPNRLGFRVMEIAAEAGIARQTAYRIVNALLMTGLVADTGRRNGPCRPGALYRMARTKREVE